MVKGVQEQQFNHGLIKRKNRARRSISGLLSYPASGTLTMEGMHGREQLTSSRLHAQREGHARKKETGGGGSAGERRLVVGGARGERRAMVIAATGKERGCPAWSEWGNSAAAERALLVKDGYSGWRWCERAGRGSLRGRGSSAREW